MEEKLKLPQLLAQPLAVQRADGPMAYLMLSPYGGAAPEEIESFPKTAFLTPATETATVRESKWRFWANGDGTIGAGFDGWVVVPSLKAPNVWALLAHSAQQIVISYAPELRHPTDREMAKALAECTGWWTTGLLGKHPDPFATVKP